MRKKLFLFIPFLQIAFLGQAQNEQTKAVLTADSLATGNYKDLLTSFFQLSFDKLTSKDKELKFSSNPYAVMMKANKELESYNNYKKNRVLRNLNFNFSLRLDTSYRFNGFSSGISYAIINKRDFTVYDEFIDLALLKSGDLHILSKGISRELSGIGDVATRNKLREQIFDKLFNDENFKFGQLDENAKAFIKKVIQDDGLKSIAELIKKDPNVNFRKIANTGYEEVKKSFQQKPLLTFAVSDTTTQNQLMFSNIALKLEYLQGLFRSKPGANWEFNIPATINFLNDTLLQGNNLKRVLFRLEPGINLVLRSNDGLRSFFEMQLSAAYNRFFSGNYMSETKERFTLNSTLRIKIINEIWVPLQINYDPKNGKFFGFLNVRFNFSAQGNNKKD